MRALLLALVALVLHAGEARPNVLMIVAEDFSPHLGCYGDAVARTPHLDALAKEGARFTRAFTHAPVCAPSRSGLITGRYPTSIGSHHMRSTLLSPPPLFTQGLQAAGYAVHWPGKTDFNFAVPKEAFSDSEDFRKLTALREPFFAYVNIMTTHESQFRKAPAAHRANTAAVRPEQRQDAATVPLPPYFPDVAEVRRDVAQYHETATAMDDEVGAVLRTLAERGVAGRTLVIFFGDHGWGLPRGKRWLYDSGLQVPLLMRWPGVIAPGSVREDLVALLDLAPTLLDLAGAPVAKELDGRVMLGPRTAPEPPYLLAARDRMDENQDRCRSVRDRQYRYIRNFEPEKPWFRFLAYQYQTPTMQAWYRAAAAGTLDAVQGLWWTARKPDEELYDCAADPHQVRNLAGDPAQAERLAAMRAALDQWIARTGDLGAVPEEELIRRGLVADRLNTEYRKRSEQAAAEASKWPWPPKATE